MVAGAQGGTLVSDELDLGHDHFLRFMTWAPDDLPQNRELYLVPLGGSMPRIEKAGAMVRHPRGGHLDGWDDDGWCHGGITFEIEGSPLKGPRWVVKSWEPLTLSPSLGCSCGDHGWVKEGLWVPA